MVRPARLPCLLPPRECELRREYAAGVEAPERDWRDEAPPDLVRAWWRWWDGDSASKGMETRLVELSRLESQLWPFSSLVDEARAMPARSIHSASDLVLSPNWRRACKEPGCFLCVVVWWWSGRVTFLLCRLVSLDGPARVELLLRRVWRVRDELRECERMGGVLGTETLER